MTCPRDKGDAPALAGMVRIDRDRLRPVAGDSDRAQAVRIVARAHQTLVWERTRTYQRLRAALREPQVEVAAPRTAAYAAAVTALARLIIALNAQIDVLEGEVKAHFRAHPDAEVYLSMPGIGEVTGARVLAEFGDDPGRYTSAKARKNYAGARRYYDEQRARKLDYNPALRQLGNRLVGILHGCLKTHSPYDEGTVWAHHTNLATA